MLVGLAAIVAAAWLTSAVLGLAIGGLVLLLLAVLVSVPAPRRRS